MRRLRPPSTALAALGLVLATSASTPAQDRELTPLFGQHTLSVGFYPDPVSFPVMAGGGDSMLDISERRLIDAGRGTACGTFFVDTEPSFRLDLTGEIGEGFRFVRLYTDVPRGSRTDPALLVQQPDGRWRCADDSHEGTYQGLMPIIDLEDPLPGSYAIWVGSYLRNPAEPATLFVTAYRSNLPSPNGY